MASIQLSAITGNSMEEIINAIERQRKDIEFIMANLDDDNIKEVSGEKVVNLTIDQAQIRSLLVDTANIKDLAVSSAKIANASITSAKIEDAAITNAKIDRATINKLVVTTADIADANITTAKIKDASITTAKIGDAQITTAKIQQAQITGALIANATILTANIADAQITSAKIASAAVETANIKDASITSAKIGSAQITTGLIADAAITTALIADLAVSDAKIVSITANKLTAGTIDASKINVTNLVADNIVTGTITIASANLFMNTDARDIASIRVGNGALVKGQGAANLGPENGSHPYLALTQSTTGWMPAYLDRVPLKGGQTVTITGYYTHDATAKNTNMYLLCSDTLEGTEANKTNTSYNSNIGIITLGTPAGTGWTKFSRTVTLDPAIKSGFIRFDHNGSNTAGTNSTVRFAAVMVQYGNISTKWQPHTNEMLAEKGITNLQIGDSAVDNRVITANTITGDRLVVDAITTREIKAGSITAASGIIANATIGTAQIIDSAITTAKIGDAQITNAKIASLDAEKITTGYLDAARVKIGAATTFDAGYNPADKISATGMQTSNTSASYGGQWTKVGTVVIKTQYYNTDADIVFTGGSSGSSVGRWAKIHWRVKQQNAMGSAPFVSIHYLEGYAIEPTHFKAVTVTNTATETKVELYVQINITYEGYAFTPLNITANGSLTWHQGAGFIATLPTGTQTDSEDKSHKPTTALVDGWKYPNTTYIDGGDIYTNTITANSIASRTITANEIATNAITANEIAASTITANEIAAAAITVDKLDITAKSLINNWTKSGSLKGWTSSSGLVLETDATMGSVAKLTSSGNIQIFSDYFEVDPTKTYKVTMAVKVPTNNGTQFFGLHAYGASGSEVAVTPFSVSNRTFGTATTNPYFWNSTASYAGWYVMEAYILGCNVTDPKEVPEGKNVSSFWRMPPNATKVRLRFLNYYQATGTTTVSYWHSPSVTEIDAGKITANQLSVTTLSAITANIGNVTAGNITGVTITGSTLTSTSGTNSISLSGATFTSKVNNRDMVKITGSDISIYDDGLNDPTPGYGLLSTFGSGYTVETPEERGFQITNYGDFFAVGKKINTVTERHLFTDYKKRESIISGSPEDAEGTGTLNLRSSFYSTNRGNYLPGIQIINSGNYAGIYNYFGRNNDAGADATDYFLYDVRMYTGNNAGGSKSMIMARRAGTEYRVEVADNLYSSGKIHGAQQPYFMSGTGADVALGAGAWTRLNLNSSPQKNIGGGSFASGEYTVPDAGQYLVEAVINITPTGGSTYYISAFYNGVHYDDNRMAQKQASGGYDNILAGSTIVNCNAGDTISLRAYASTATTLAFQYMKIYKLP